MYIYIVQIFVLLFYAYRKLITGGRIGRDFLVIVRTSKEGGTERKKQQEDNRRMMLLDRLAEKEKRTTRQIATLNVNLSIGRLREEEEEE